MKKFTMILICLFLALPSYAGGAVHKSKIAKISFNSAGFFLSLETRSNPNGCTSDAAVVLKKTDSNYDKAYAMLLAAYYTGKEISGYSDECVAHDAFTYNTIRGFKYLVVH